MKNKTVLFITFFVVAAAIAVMVAGRESISAVVEDAIHWFHVTSPGQSGGDDA
jgi:hypothetical protein